MSVIVFNNCILTVNANTLSISVIPVLSFDTNDAASDFLQNATINVDEETMKKVGEICGARFCPGVGANENPNLIPPPPEKIQMLSGIFLGCMLLAVLLIVFLVDSQKR